MTEEAESVFISYAKPDRAWAKWVAWHLREAGHRVELDVWNWSTGDDFIQRMSDAVARATVVVALYSDDYFGPDRWTREERNAVAARRGRMVPLVLAPLTVDVPAHFAPLLWTDLYGLGESAAAKALLGAVNGPTADIDTPAFPPNAPDAPNPAGTPAFPGARTPDGPGPSAAPDRPEVWEVSVGRTPYFTGREEVISQVREGLRGGRFILRGLGGIGKTQIALEYAHRFAGQYDIVWWIDAEQADQLPVHYTELATRLGIAKPDAGAEHNTRALMDHLRTHDRWLIILDNAQNPDHFSDLLPTGPGHVLITSRSAGWKGSAADHNLDVFTRDESTAYLTTRLPDITPDQADALASDLGDLPLALAQAAGTLTTGVSLDRYRQLLAGKARELLAHGAPAEYSSPLAATVTIAATRLADDCPAAAALLRIGAFLGPDPIPTDWLENAGPHLATVTVDPDDILWPQQDLQALARFGLARLGYGTFQVHRLTQAILRDHTPTADRARINADVSTILATVDPGDPGTPASWPKWAALTAHLVALQDTATEHPELRRTILQALDYLIESGQSRAAHDLAGSLHTTWSTVHGPDHPDVLTCAQLFSFAVGNLGDYAEARRITEDILERRGRTLGADHPDTLHSAQSLASALFYLGEYEKARGMVEDILARRRLILGPDHPNTLASAHALGSALFHLEEYAEDRRITEDTLERRRRVLGADHPDTLNSAQSLGVTLHSLGEYDEAKRIAEEIFEQRRRLLGADHPDTLDSAHYLSNALHSLGELAEDHRIAEDNLERRRRVLGVDHPDTLLSAQSLGVSLASSRRYPEAEQLLRDARTRSCRTLGADHPLSKGLTENLATVLIARGKLREAHKLQRGRKPAKGRKASKRR
ncbi:ATP-binding protein [Streptomyces lucensis JCM 4490]|uniref:ATP-binding protein n=1 Tax=Streptomyces lucensis JCM 4490 TaxID=1306176 RepID=A0A918IVE7_9ACTN|nr:FxSxx-COOH system tetratricopeptide repeat protein [Streptomyces lucensis]GGW33788.1 ATP-binding protein [Streptomyces lucensis JCM 4490]